MQAAVLHHPSPADKNPLTLEEVPIPIPAEGEALLKVLACGICRTDLHIIEGDLPQRLPAVIPGHQIVAEIVTSPDPAFRPGHRVGVSWIGGTDGTCPFCRSGRENLCDHPTYTGYTHNGGYAEFTTARTDFLQRIPDNLSDTAAAPLLCAGIIGYRSLKVAEVKRGQRVGLFGFGSSAQLLFHVLRSWDCEIYVPTRGAQHQQAARSLGATWVGEATDIPPRPLDSAITFAPSGDVVLAALKSLAKGGIVAINAIHLDRMPAFDYDSLLWGERQLRSVTNMTRQDATEFLHIAADLQIKPAFVPFPLAQVNDALAQVKAETLAGTAVLLPHTR